MINVTVNGVVYPVPSSAADVDWAAKQVAFEQALAAAIPIAAVRRLYTNAVQVGSGADTLEDALMQYSVLANVLAAGKGVRVTAWGAGVNTADATTLRAYVAGQKVIEKVLTASQANTWRAQLDLLCIDANNATLTGLLTQGGTVTQLQVVSISSFAAPVAAPILFNFTGQRAASSVANSVVQYGMSVELIP